MTHLVSPTSFRLGKTHTWKANGISKNSINTNVVSTKIGINSLLKYKLRRRRLYVVKSSIRIYSKYINIKSLFMPRIKVKPKSDGLGCFSKYMLYKRHNQTSPIFLNSTKMYIDERRLKVFKFPHKKNSQINRWISRRMFRGSHDKKFKTSFKLDPSVFSNKINNCSYYMNKVRIKNNKHKKYLIKSQKKNYKYIKVKAKQQKKLSPNKKRIKKLQWWRTRSKFYNVTSNQKISHYLSSVLNEQITVKLVNIFYYLAMKQMIKFRSHQEHFWNRRFRRFRFQYDNYYDIVNSFFILGLIKNSENLLLAILRIMMPRIRKIRRFMYFLDAILKNLPQIQANFSCFRITITGKTQGGTKRTKTFSIGFGHLPYQSIQLEGTNAFVSYPHKFGEFGIKLIMNRTYIDIYKNVSKQWVIKKDPSPLAYILEPEKRK
jgi:hypothetical protein